MMTTPISPLISVTHLYQHLQDDNLIVLDATLPSSINGQCIHPSLANKAIANARFFDLQHICDLSSPLPHTLPSPELFTAAVRALGINQDSNIVIYDKFGIYSAPRAWWMFKAMGHNKVAVLDGGLPAWQAAGYPLVDGHFQASTLGNFNAQLITQRLYTASDILHMLTVADARVKIIDARSPARFYGRSAEPRAGLKSGHIPHAINIPFEHVLHQGKLLDKPALATLFSTALGSPAPQTLVASCGSGITACILLLAAEQAGYTQLKLYDGSWSEWGALDGYPVVSE